MPELSPLAASLAAGLLAALVAPPATAGPNGFTLAPAVAVEAEHFTVDDGWTVIKNGEGNYMVDMIGFQHISGERVLGADKADHGAAAHLEITVPEAGAYRLWARYEYPPFSESRFEVAIEQNGQTIARKVMGVADNPRWAFTDFEEPQPQWDPAWGAEGLAEEVVDVPGLEAGPARLVLRTVEQPQVPGRAADRNIDLLYLTRDTGDAWRAHYRRRNRLYPILDAFRDSVGARWEARFTNRGKEPASYRAISMINRVPWAARPGTVTADVAPGERSAWIPLSHHDVAHFHMGTFSSAGPFELELRPRSGIGFETASEGRTLESDAKHHVRVYLPPYPHWGERPVTPVEQIEAVLAHLEATPAPGRVPTVPLAYGGWIPVGDETAYGRAYGRLYKAIGMRAIPSTGTRPATMRAIGIEPTRTLAASGYRNPPTAENVEKARQHHEKTGTTQYLRYFDYGDEIHFAEWVNLATGGDTEKLHATWRRWLAEHRPDHEPADYWRPGWGDLAPDALRPDSSAKAARENPHLYVDSLRFYEEMAIDYVAEGLERVKEAFGDHVLGGANYSAHPFYYPHVSMYVHWFRDGAADFGRHSEYFWQVTQAGPMINGYLAEHFRAGMRFNPEAKNRQYTMPHLPGNTERSFLRTAFTHLAHGADSLDYFGIGMNETFTENHVDHRGRDRYRQVRDVNHSMGLVEDMLPDSEPVASRVGLLLSDSTERWDFAPGAGDRARVDQFGKGFRNIRLNFHFDRLGIWKALTFFGESPDLLVEEDLRSELLAGYRVLYVVGDALPAEAAPVLEAWVKAGGVLMATSGAGQFDPYRAPNPAWQKLLGLARREVEREAVFFRPRQELAFMAPIGNLAGDGWEMPVLSVRETIAPADGAQVIGRDGEGQSAVLERRLGDGRVIYAGAHPGVSFLWGALHPPVVPDRGPNTHTVPVDFDPGAKRLILSALVAAGVEPTVSTDPGLIDTRLVAGPGGYFLPLANYHREVGRDVTITLRRIEGAITKVTSAYRGELEVRQDGDAWIVTVPELGYGDMLRIETARSGDG